MKILLILFSIQTTMADLPVPDVDVWSVGTKYYFFKKDLSNGALLSEDCLKNPKNCEAYQAVLNKNKVVLSEADRRGGKNPGAVVCKKQYGGEILILKNNAGNESAFCKFKDNSIASAADLY